MPEEKDVRKFREMLDGCLDESIKKLDLNKVSDEKKAGMIDKFKKAMWR
jgi:hypothetical protein